MILEVVVHSILHNDVVIELEQIPVWVMVEEFVQCHILIPVQIRVGYLTVGTHPSILEQSNTMMEHKDHERLTVVVMDEWIQMELIILKVIVMMKSVMMIIQ